MKSIIALFLMLVVALSFAPAYADAAAAPAPTPEAAAAPAPDAAAAPAESEFVGKIEEVKDAEGKVTGYLLVVGEEKHELVAEKAAEFVGKDVVVKGVVEEKEGKKTLKASSIVEKTAEAPKTEEPKAEETK